MFSGTLADPLRSMGATPQIGLFPAAGAIAWREDGKRADMLDALHDDRLRSQDSSRAPATTDVRLVATFVDCANSDEDRDRDRMGASMLTADGDRVTFRRARGLDFIDEIVWLPVGSTWQVGWDWGQTAPFQVGSAPLLVTGTYRCTDDGVRLEDVAVGEVISSAEPGPSTSIGRGS